MKLVIVERLAKGAVDVEELGIDAVIKLLGKVVAGAKVGVPVGPMVRLVGSRVGECVTGLKEGDVLAGLILGAEVGTCVVGSEEGAALEGVLEGRYVGSMVGSEVLATIGVVEGTLVGSHELGEVMGLLVGTEVGSVVGN